jgi:NitT/TauT family transport system substrate-binding protein
MARFRISSHGRLQDWIAAEKGYFDEEGLDYEFNVVMLERAASEDAESLELESLGRGGDVRVGAYELYRARAGGKRDMSCACHWAVNQVAAEQHGRMWGHAYSVLPCGIYVAPDSDVRAPADLADVEIGVGYHSGSHFSAIQALEAVLAADEINLSFVGQPYDRIDALLARDLPAANVWGAATYLLEQQGFRKVLDSTFMAGFLFNTDTDPEDVRRYFNGLKRAQMDLDFQPERHKHHYLKEIPERFHAIIDVRGFGTGERVVFLPYTQEVYERSQRWMRERHLFEDDGAPPAFESVVQV